jgi:hypothetical protein
MPRALRCECGECQTCQHREYMRKYRHKEYMIGASIVRLSSWEQDVAAQADALCRYVCPLVRIIEKAPAMARAAGTSVRYKEEMYDE